MIVPMTLLAVGAVAQPESRGVGYHVIEVIYGEKFHSGYASQYGDYPPQQQQWREPLKVDFHATDDLWEQFHELDTLCNAVADDPNAKCYWAVRPDTNDKRQRRYRAGEAGFQEHFSFQIGNNGKLYPFEYGLNQKFGLHEVIQLELKHYAEIAGDWRDSEAALEAGPMGKITYRIVPDPSHSGRTAFRKVDANGNGNNGHNGNNNGNNGHNGNNNGDGHDDDNYDDYGYDHDDDLEAIAVIALFISTLACLCAFCTFCIVI